MIRSICLSLCYTVSHSLEQDYCKSNHPISLKLDVMTGATSSRKNLLTFGGDLVPSTDSGSLPLPSPLQNRGFLVTY